MVDFHTFNSPDWDSGTAMLSRDEEYVLFKISYLFVMFDGVLKDDDHAMRNRCKMSMQAYRKIKNHLLDIGKIEVRDGLIIQGRAEKELKKALKTSEKAAEKAKKRWGDKPKKINENNKPPKAAAHTNSGNSLSKPDGLDSEGSPPDLFEDSQENKTNLTEKAMAMWNEMAGEKIPGTEQTILPLASKPTAQRKSRIPARLRDCGGLEGWKVALEKVRASPYLLGEVNGWKADLDFVLREDKFTKIMEGGFDDRKKPRGKPGAVGGISAAMARIVDREHETAGDVAGDRSGDGEDRTKPETSGPGGRGEGPGSGDDGPRNTGKLERNGGDLFDGPTPDTSGLAADSLPESSHRMSVVSETGGFCNPDQGGMGQAESGLDHAEYRPQTMLRN